VSAANSVTDALVAAALAHEAEFPGARAVIPRKHVTIVTCMDSRIDVFRIFGLEEGDAHVIRNAGGLVSDDVLRSLVLSQRFLETREVVLVHHTDCGLQRFREEDLQATLASEVGAPAPYAFGAFDDLEAAVRRAIARVAGHAFLPHRANVRGFVYDVATGHLREVVP
jgi:carbonic anhydrase